ncbi:MAG: major capsid protein P2 [Reinekea sp.]|nr:major capsid protein P2 [Reinekea sp.]
MQLRKIPKKSQPTQSLPFSIRPKVGLTYDLIALKLTNVTKAELKNIQVLVRGKPIQAFRTGKVLQDMNDFYGRPDLGAGWLVFYFMRPEFRQLEKAKVFSLGTVDVDTLEITFDVMSASASPDIDVYAQVSEPRPLGVITKIRQYAQDFSQAGTKEIADLPTGKATIAGLHFATSEVSEIKLEGDSRAIVESMPVEAIETFLSSHFLNPVTGYRHLSFVAEGDPARALPTQGIVDLRSTIELDNPAAFDVVVEYFDTYSGL